MFFEKAKLLEVQTRLKSTLRNIKPVAKNVWAQLLVFAKNYEIKFRDSAAVSFILHATLIIILIIISNPKVVEIPFRVIYVKIGSYFGIDINKINEEKNLNQVKNIADTSKEAKKNDKKEAIAKNVTEAKKSVVRTEIVPVGKPTEKKEIKSQGVKQIKTVTAKEVNKKVKGERFGNRSEAERKSIESYEQLLSVWIEKHKVYPENAKRYGIEGVVKIRLSIARNGDIVRHSFLQKTGSYLLDDSVELMIESSNPAPPIPFDYPSDDSVIDFDVPIRFVIENN